MSVPVTQSIAALRFATGGRRLPLYLALAAAMSPFTAGANTLEEVVVTAQKREQSLQDVGITVAALSGETIEKLGVYNSNDLANSIPNLNIESPVGEGGVSVVFIRGVGLNDFATNNSGPVGFYIDEVYAGSSNSQSAALFDIDRIEVLKGPQGTLYGRNTTGGAISLMSRKPSTETEGYVRGSYGSYSTGEDEFRIEGAVGGSLSDTVQARIAGVTYHSDGYMKNLISTTYVEKDRWAARAQLNWTPIDRLNLLFNVHASDNNSDADLYNSSADADFYSGVSDINPVLRVEQSGASMKIDYTLTDSIDLVSITAWDTLEKLHQEDADMLPAPIVHPEYGVDADSISQELRLSGGDTGAVWIAGLYYFDESLDQDQGVNLTGAGLPVPYRYDNTQDLTTWAVFGQYEFDLSPTLTLTTGLRYTQLDVDFTSVGTGTFFLDSSVPGGITDSYRFADDLNEDNLSGKLALDWRPRENVLVYTSLSRGFKGAGYNGNFHINADAIGSYDSEELTAWEVGTKTRFADDRLQLNAAAFYYDYDDAQIFNNAPIPGIGLPSNAIRNADASMQGLDLDLRWAPVDGFYVQLGLGYVDATYDQSIVDPVTGPLPLDGNAVQNTPELSAFGLASYEWQLGDGSRFAAQVDASYTDDVYYSAFEDSAVGQSAYTLLGSRLSWYSPDDAFEIALWGKNLGDKEYAAYVFDLRPDFGFLQRMRGVPRTVGIDLQYRF